MKDVSHNTKRMTIKEFYDLTVKEIKSKDSIKSFIGNQPIPDELY